MRRALALSLSLLFALQFVGGASGRYIGAALQLLTCRLVACHCAQAQLAFCSEELITGSLPCQNTRVMSTSIASLWQGWLVLWMLGL
jgi:hypothetical protein